MNVNNRPIVLGMIPYDTGKIFDSDCRVSDIGGVSPTLITRGSKIKIVVKEDYYETKRY